MTSLSRTPNQLLRVGTRLAGAFVEGDIAPTATAVLVNGQARDIPVTLVRLDDGNLFPSTVFPGQYGLQFDGSSLAIGDLVEILFRTRSNGRTLDDSVCGRVCSTGHVGVDFQVPPVLPGGGDGGGTTLENTSRVGYVGNSFTSNYGSMPSLLEYYLGETLPGSAVVLGAPPYLGAGTSIANDDDGYFPAMTLGGMALYPIIDQRQVGGSTDAIDALASQPPGTYGAIVLTSGFRQDTTGVEGIEYEFLPGAGGTGNQFGVILEIKRRVIAEINSRMPGVPVLIRMTQEGFNANVDADLSDMERNIRLQVLGARQIEAEGIALQVIPEHYVWSRLTIGRFGSAGVGLDGPVPAYIGLTHSDSDQPGGRNYAWLNRSQGDAAPFTLNAHQNALATIVAAWTNGYLLWGIDPRGDTTFQSNAGLPSPFDRMLSDNGRIYGGQLQGLGTDPYNAGLNPGGPPDSELDLDWSLTTQAQIQDRIVAACDDYVAGTTEFD